MVPAALSTSCGIDADAIEYQGEFVDQRDIDVALGVFDDLGRLGDLDALALMRAGDDDAAVESIDEVGDLRCRARGHFLDVVRRCCLSPGLMRSGL